MKTLVKLHYAIYSPEEFYYISALFDKIGVRYVVQIGRYGNYIECIAACTDDIYTDIELFVSNECIPFA